jgi:transcription antitermination protein NusB
MNAPKEPPARDAASDLGTLPQIGVIAQKGPVTRRSSRRRSREFALQGLYQWQLAGTDAATIERQMSDAKGFDKIDRPYFSALLAGSIREAQNLEQSLQPYLDRKCTELSPIERAILLIAAYELANQPDVPYRVVLNEAVELAKSYGGTDGFKYVNGVLDKLAPQARPHEASRN